MNTCLLVLCLSLGPSDRAPVPDRFWGEDKLKHFFTSFVVTSLAASGARIAGLDPETSMLVGAGTGAVLGVGKEISDLGREGSTASVKDILWDLAGVGAATAVQARTF